MERPAEAFPLQWPTGHPRTRQPRRSNFAARSIAAAFEELRREMRLLKATAVVMSSNIPLRRDGLPLSGVREPKDPGVAVYFRLRTGPHVIACDRWDRVSDNITAIARHVGAIRGMDRWGCGSLEQAFAGYRALAAVDARKPWWEVLGMTERATTAAAVRERFHALAKLHHPDRGENPNQMAEITAAYNEAVEELGS